MRVVSSHGDRRCGHMGTWRIALNGALAALTPPHHAAGADKLRSIGESDAVRSSTTALRSTLCAMPTPCESAMAVPRSLSARGRWVPGEARAAGPPVRRGRWVPGEARAAGPPVRRGRWVPGEARAGGSWRGADRADSDCGCYRVGAMCRCRARARAGSTRRARTRERRPCGEACRASDRPARFGLHAARRSTATRIASTATSSRSLSTSTRRT
jgi:hypothetical protein